VADGARLYQSTSAKIFERWEKRRRTWQISSGWFVFMVGEHTFKKEKKKERKVEAHAN
jgi:hypothetical protein